MSRRHAPIKARRGLRGEIPLIVLGVFLVALFYGSLRRSAGPPTTGTSSSMQIPPFHESVKDAQPFPATPSPAPFKEDPVVAQAYAMAQKNPGPFAQQPCYCWCSRDEGHRSLPDCYASRHAPSCDICIRETVLAGSMHRVGNSPREIRAAIIRGEWQSRK